jgi:hypothetical protein
LASGGNDNKLYVWSVHNNKEPAGKFQSHLAAVKVKILSFNIFFNFKGNLLESTLAWFIGKWGRHSR